jgi:hypothetical protein
MAANRSRIHLADLIVAMRLLKPDDGAQENIAAILGFKIANRVINEIPRTEDNLPSCSQPKLKEPESKEPDKPIEVKDKISMDFSMEIREESLPIEVPLPKLPQPLRDRYGKDGPLLKHYPLINPKWARAIITKLLSMDAYEGSPDIILMIKIISQNRIIRKIPCKSIPTLRRGVQVLIDIGPGMVPYMRDQESLIEQLYYIVGRDRIEVWGFIGTPLEHAISRNLPNLTHYLPPSPGTPILILTDFGIANLPFKPKIASIDNWKSFIRFANDMKFILLALTPYSSDRWPLALKNWITIIPWDRMTNLITVLRSLKNKGTYD